MLKNPYKNAVLAAGYIAILVLIIWSTSSFDKDGQDNIFIPITMLSLLVLSVSTMALLFFYTPTKMLLENQREEALSFFVKTIATFACFVAIFAILILLV